MKVLHVAHQTWPEICGSVSRLDSVLQALATRNIQSVVLSSPFQPSAAALEIEEHQGFKYYRSSTWRSVPQGFSQARSLRLRVLKLMSLAPFLTRIISVAKTEQVSLIHAHATFAMAIPAIIAGKLLGIPVIYEMRSTWEEDIQGPSLIKWAIKRFEALSGKFANGVVFLSTGIKNHYFGVSTPRNFSIIYNSSAPPAVEASSHKDSSPNFGYVGSLVQYEGLDVLAHAIAKARRQVPHIKVFIYGKGPEKQTLERLIGELDIASNMILCGEVSKSAIDEAYRNFEVVVLPRLDLPITQKVVGLKPVEAFSRKKLVLASDVGGMREIFQDTLHGLFVAPGNADALATKLIDVWENYAKHLETISRAHELYRDKFTIEAMGSQYERSYRCIMKEL